MPNPLAILGALSTVGAQGARGALEGSFEGQEVQRKRMREDEQNRIRALEAILKGQEIQRGNQPTYAVQGGRMITQPPFGPPSVTELPETGPEKSLRLEREATTAWRQKQAAGGGKGPTEAEAKGAIITEYMQRLQTEGPLKAQEWLKQTLAAIHAAESKEAASAGFTLAPGARRYDESGKIIAEAPAKPRGGLTDRTTTTTGFRIIPGKEITDLTELGQLRTALPQIINEIAGSPNIQGWMDPGPLVRVAGYPVPVRREDVIKHAFKKRLGLEAEVRWDGRNWVLVRAKIPTTKERTEQTRTTGPATSAPESDEEQ